MLSLTDDAFEELVEKGLESIDPKYHKAIQNVAVVIEPRPEARHREIASIGHDETLYGLYEGVPLPERGSQYMFTLPDKISIFREPILEVAEDIGEAQTIVENTLWHEFAHYFGWNEEDVMEREVRDGRDAF